ncbi:DUF4914 family protein [Microcystis aeruginosa]|jgi:hypothetical protein|uniref:DUF4914 domain-containing protein n=1 Tax=Microcystis aeruginosa (strain NIES-843 / IAM M-2473) TaxID=449447 RepID=B0JW12_MICAN|nr:DUF4914 family protein [Microcystis aeruginosa]BAG04755.1 hypothetical protein MAE_49330 [Microcystis aeruginosa NIES-843]
MVVNPLPDFSLPSELTDILQSCPNFTLAADVEQLIELAVKDAKNGYHEVAYDIPNRGKVVEALVCRVRNGISANYTEPYMRRRDPDCMVIGDDLPTNKPTFKSRFGFEFEELRQQTFAWLKTQELALFTFVAGVKGKGPDVVVVAPANAGFFALGLSLLQGIDDPSEIGSDFLPGAVLYVAPPFRHQVFQGKQVVVHNRRPGLHELFSYNLYPGPSAKKGIYGVLLAMGEQENWVTAHASTVQVITPYDNKVTFMHEGASGGGKSEMLEPAHRRPDGSLLLGKNLVTGDERHLILPKTCDLRPVTDDMALCHPSLRQPKNQDKLALMDAENAWFVRLNHITHYGTDPYLEELTIHPPHPLLFLNIEARPESTALIWQHIEDEPGKPCPNPRVVIPRDIIPNVVNGAVSVDIRSFGVRTPPCTKERPSYGIIGLLHLLPPALAWLWRLVAPRGHANPSIVEKEGMSSEGVGSYWPFATGRRVIQANLILQQILTTPKVRYTLCPNQYIGAWEVGFMAQWIAREYLARRGGEKFSRQQVVPSRCPLLGYTFRSMMVEGQTIGNWFFRVNLQPEVGNEAFDRGTTILKEFFAGQLRQFLEPDLDPLGKTIIDCCLSDASLEDYERLIPYPIISDED